MTSSAKVIERICRHGAPLLLACAMLSSPNALAQESSASDKALAESLFQQGRKLLKKKNFDEACPKFAESYRLAERLGTLLNLATCHQRQGRTASAWAEFTEAAAKAKAEKRRDREKYARSQAAALEKKLSTVLIKMAEAPEGASLELDGKAIGRAVWGSPVPVDPGSHELTLSAPGMKTHTESLNVEDGPSEQTVELPTLEDAPASEAAGTPGPGTESSSGGKATATADAGTGSGSSTLGWVALGVGVVGVGVGSYFGLQTFSKQKDSEDHCDGTACDQAGVDLRDEASGAATISTVAFGVGIVGVALGSVLLLTSGNSEKDTAVWVAPAVSTTGGGAHLVGSF